MSKPPHRHCHSSSNLFPFYLRFSLTHKFSPQFPFKCSLGNSNTKHKNGSSKYFLWFQHKNRTFSFCSCLSDEISTRFNKKEKITQNYLLLYAFFTACNKNRWMCNKLAKQTMRFIIYFSARSYQAIAIPREKNRTWRKNHKIQFTMNTRQEMWGVSWEILNLRFSSSTFQKKTAVAVELSVWQVPARMAFLILKLSTYT